MMQYRAIVVRARAMAETMTEALEQLAWDFLASQLLEKPLNSHLPPMSLPVCLPLSGIGQMP